MRTIFEDSNERANREDDQSGKNVPMLLWLVALLAIGGLSGAIYYVLHRKPPEPPPVAVSLESQQQVNQAVNKFNTLVKYEKWDEAQAMLSADAQKRLADEKKSLKESLLGFRKGKTDKVIEASPTESGNRTPSTVRVDCVYYFAPGDQQIIPITVVKENERLAIESW